MENLTEDLFADIALNLPSLGTFQYSVPKELEVSATPGKRVWVSLRTRRMVGTIVGLSRQRAVAEVKALDAVIEEAPVLSGFFLELTRWMSEYYFCSWGQCIEAGLPAPFRKGKFFMKSRAKKWTEGTESVNPQDLPLTPHQETAYHEVLKTMRAGEAGCFLLYGITGSGKTEVYMHLIREALREGKGAIVLVPEISLTPQTIDRFYSRFGDCLAVVHSRLPQARRVEEWHRICNGQARVVVGARSAVFSPVKNLGLIIIDEEHETSYKQEETPRYVAGKVARKRSEIERAVVVSGSATPSLESFFETQSGKTRKLSLPERIERRPLPSVEVVDMRRQLQGKGPAIFSTALEQNIREGLSRNEQAMLLLNRRGFSTYLHCAACGYVMICENCRISLAYHYDKASLFCHVCHYRTTPQRLCPGCRKGYLHYFGVGTQKVEIEAARLLPGARLGRMDSDSTSKKDAHELILRAFKHRQIDILIGTQMIAKGHDFPHVSLIGVISADTALHIPDFKAAERTFSLLTQVAGRAGRGDIPGKVLIQTYVPQHYSIQNAKNHDYESFYAKEIEFRRELFLPPFSHLVKIVISGTPEREVVRHILSLAKLFETRRAEDLFRLMGPAPCLVSKEKGQYHWNLYLKTKSAEAVRPLISEVLATFKKTKVRLTVDVDPQ